jgi:phosphoribosylformylglycinamidine synthase
MESFRGGAALSPLRRARALARLRERVPRIGDCDIEYLYFVDLARALGADERARLEALLGAGGAPAARAALATLLVVPRPGTLSPWSSKATDIARNCALAAVGRIERGCLWRLRGEGGALTPAERAALAPLLHDRMTEVVLEAPEDAHALFDRPEPRPLTTIPLAPDGLRALSEVNAAMGLALSEDEIRYLAARYRALGRDPSDIELMMFAQANSEHCRHKIFNADWRIDGQPQPQSPFAMIRNTHARNPGRILSAYVDNAAVAEGYHSARFLPADGDGVYAFHAEEVHLLAKVETHNHPTAIAPHPGAATGAGGEIRDEAATGRAPRPRAGFTGFSVSHLRLPGFAQPWERPAELPPHVAPALDIMLEGPIGAAAYNNEFGRPALGGYFRTFEASIETTAGIEQRGYHKPVMLAGGFGNVRPGDVRKRGLPPGAALVLLGGPAMRIGLGGGAASSMSAGAGDAELDFASVQRANAEMQRRCQEVIDRCTALGERNPILSIHDVGAGGLANAVPELLHAAGRGARVELRDVPNDEPGMSPLEIWCNEAQERYVLALEPSRLADLERMCRRERCPFAVIGAVTTEQRLIVTDRASRQTPIDLPMDLLFGALPPTRVDCARKARVAQPLDTAAIDLAEAVARVLRFPAVADKTFLVTIGDRSVSGLVARDQMVGPWQIPVADCAVTASSYRDYTGEAAAIGERAPLALLDPAACARMAVGEALTNLAAARVMSIGEVLLSANWMAASGHDDAALFEAVRALGMELCPALGVAVPVGKDSLSMKTVWQGGERCVIAPVTLVVSAFAPVVDVRMSLTPELQLVSDSVLLLVDLGRGRNRLGGSALAQVYGRLGEAPPDLEAPEDLRAFFETVQLLNEAGQLLAYHDRSDGGLLATVCEMAFAARAGVEVDVEALGGNPIAALFAEELGAVVQVRGEDAAAVVAQFERHPGLAGHVHRLGAPAAARQVVVRRAGELLFRAPLATLHRAWAETSYRMQRLRDDPDCADEAWEALLDETDPGLSVQAGGEAAAAPAAATAMLTRPRVAILREQGVNGQVEMAAAFDRGGFAAVDVHMTDILEGRVTLDGFRGLAAGGGFSYGDVLGAGGGWAKSILHNDRARDQFRAFFERADTFALGVCNGCQMLSHLRELIPGAADFPPFRRNRSEQFEARLVMVEVLASPSVLLAGMAGARLPIVVAHGEGRADVEAPPSGAALRFIDNLGRPAARYPANPNGSPGGLTGFASADGRVTIMMPHPERVFRSCQYSWLPKAWRSADGPWLKLFENARRWVG